MNGKVSKYLKRTNEVLAVPSVHFSKQRTDSVESLVVEDDPEEDEEEIDTAPKDTRVEINIDDFSNQKERDDLNEEGTEVTKQKKTVWNFFKWLWAHIRIRKWVGRGLQAFGQGFMYTSPVSATVVLAQEFGKRNQSNSGGSQPSNKYHQTHIFKQ